MKIQQDQRLVHFLIKLKEVYQQVRTKILMMEALPPITQAYKLILQEQKHKELSLVNHQNNKLMALVANKRFYPESNKTYKHPSSSSTGISGIKRGSHYYFTHCKIPGHSIERCFKIHGYLANWKPHQKMFDAAVQSQQSPAATYTEDNPSPVISVE